MSTRIVMEGNAFYEVDEECLRRKQGRAPISGASLPDGDEEEDWGGSEIDKTGRNQGPSPGRRRR